VCVFCVVVVVVFVVVLLQNKVDWFQFSSVFNFIFIFVLVSLPVLTK